MFSKKHPSKKLKHATFAMILISNQPVAMADQPWNCLQEEGNWNCSVPIDQSIKADLSEVLFDEPELINTSTKNTNSNSTSKTIEDSLKKIERFSQNKNLKKTISTTESTTDLAVNNEIQSVIANNYPTNKIENITSSRKEIKKTVLDFKNLDWYPYTDKKHSQGACQGRYISPQIGDKSDTTRPDLQSVFISADQSTSQIGKISTLRGNVDLAQGNRKLNSPLAKLNQETGAYSLEEGVTYRQTGLLITGDRAEGNINEEEVRLHDAQYVLHEQHIRGKADTITRKSKGNLNIEDGSYSFCPPGNEDWKISADNIDIDTESGFATVKHAKIHLFGLPVFYFPVFYFPIDDRRRTGFLFPSLTITDEETETAIPFYFNIAPNIDDTLTTTILTETGLLLENELRYLNKNSTNRLSLGYLADNKKDDLNRWALGVNHQGKYGKFTTTIDYTEISDDDYFDDLNNNLDIDSGENDQLNQFAQATYQADNWRSTVLVQKYQTIDSDTTNPYERLPEIRLSGSPDINLDNISFNYRTVLTRFDRDTTGLTGTDLIVGDRLIINPSLTAHYNKTYGYLKPSLKLWYAEYNLDGQEDSVSSRQNVAVPVLEIDSGLYFDRDFSFQSKGYTQTLEPRLYGLYVPFRDQSDLPDFDTSELSFTYDSLFRDNRFSGDDRFGDAEQISLGLTTRVLSEKGSEILSASIGRAFYFNDREVRIDADDDPLGDGESDFATAITWRPNKRLRVLFDAVFDADSFSNSESTIDVQYEKDTNNVYGIRHRFTEDVRKQTTFSYIGAINDSWSALGLLQHNWLTNKVIDAAVGLEYESCCWKTRVLLRNELDSDDERDSSLSFQFILKGLGGVGSSPSSELRNKIKGFDKREEYNANE